MSKDVNLSAAFAARYGTPSEEHQRLTARILRRHEINGWPPGMIRLRASILATYDEDTLRSQLEPPDR